MAICYMPLRLCKMLDLPPKFVYFCICYRKHMSVMIFLGKATAATFLILDNNYIVYKFSHDTSRGLIDPITRTFRIKTKPSQGMSNYIRFPWAMFKLDLPYCWYRQHVSNDLIHFQWQRCEKKYPCSVIT